MSSGSSTCSTRWRPSLEKERKRLGSATGWSHDGDHSSISSGSMLSRTRGKRVRVDFSPKVPRMLLETMDKVSDTPPSIDNNSTPANLQAVPEDTSVQTPKLRSDRIMLEHKPLRQMMERHIFCPKCRSAVVVSFPTVCIASGCKIACTNDMCDFVDMDRPASAELPYLPEGSALIERTTDYAANIEFVLSFLASGNGGKEAERLLGFLGLPNSTTMEKRSFPTIEGRIAPVISDITEEILRENLVNSVKEYYGDRTYNGLSLYDQWLSNEVQLPIDQLPQLTCSADMGWQKRSSGRRYDSLSGHSFLIEASTRKPIAWCLKSKTCSICVRNKAGAPREHKCTINHEGSSGSMEPMAILEMVVSLYDQQKVLVKTIVTDDDSSIKAKLKWSNADWKVNNNTTEAPKIINRNGKEVTRPNHGELPAHVRRATGPCTRAIISG